MTKKENRIIWPDIRSVEYLTSCPDARISGKCIVVAAQAPPLIRNADHWRFSTLPSFPLSACYRSLPKSSALVSPPTLYISLLFLSFFSSSLSFAIHFLFLLLGPCRQQRFLFHVRRYISRNQRL